MYLSRSLAPVPLALALALAFGTPYEAAAHARVESSTPPFGAECRTSVRGSHVVAHCHNAYVDVDRVRLHIECTRWWDLDTDSTAVDAGPAVTVRLTGRCWKEVGSAWVSHQKR